MTARRRLSAVLALVGLALAGCVSIPTSGSVQSAPIDVESDDIDSLFLPERPQPGQSTTELVQGFVRAGRAPQNEYAIAHEYLAPGEAWSGVDRVLVASSIGTPVELDADTITLSVMVVAEVDERGRYVALPVATPQTLTFEFTQVDGEYRIVDPPPGTVLTPNGFTDTFRSYALYFFDPSFRFLVPEVHWFPAPRVANRIAAELVRGQADWLAAGVLQSAFPAGTTARAVLDAPGVDVSLNGEVRAESAITQLRMIQQLRASLASIANVRPAEVRVTAEGLALAPAPEDVVPETILSVGEVIGGFEGAVGRLGVDGVEPLGLIGERADALQPTAMSLARGRDALAVLGADGVVSLVEPTGAPVPLDSRPGLVAPTIDPFGFVWTVPADQPGGVVATAADGVPHPVPLPAEGRVRAIELSRDGSRLLVALDTTTGSRLFVVGVLRDAELAPAALHTPFELKAVAPVLDIAWVDGERVAVLLSDDDGTRVQLLPLGGPPINRGSLDGGVQLVGGNQESGLRVLTDAGLVLRPSTVGGWTPTGFVASFLGTQQ